MKASIIISTYDRPKDVTDCVNSILSFTAHNFEIIVIEASPDMHAFYQLKNQYKNNSFVKIVHSKNLIGLSRSRNIGILLAKEEVVVFIDDDCIACSDWLQNLLSEFTEKNTGVVGGRSLSLFMGRGAPTWLSTRLTPALGISHYSNERQAVPYVLGCNFAVRRNLFDELGMFREDLGRRGKLLLSNEEIELCKRIKEAGYLVIYTPKAIVKHKIYPSRLKRIYFFKRFFYGGLSEGIMYHFGPKNLFFTVKEFLKTLIFFFRNPDMFSLCSIFEKIGLIISIL
ncbi:MAG: glycosyltransferase family 2 protein [Promethearchaeota archaeon]